MAKLRFVRSGGQTGADKTGLIFAKALGLETGGVAPKGYRTDEGPDLELRDIYGLTESPTSDYAPRTKQNVADAEATLWFGRLGTPGYYCTKNAALNRNKVFYENPTEFQLTYIVNSFEDINIAGNRRRLNPAVVGLVEDAFKIIARLLEKDGPGGKQTETN